MLERRDIERMVNSMWEIDVQYRAYWWYVWNRTIHKSKRGCALYEWTYGVLSIKAEGNESNSI